jgi:HK97 family phage prohead protease
MEFKTISLQDAQIKFAKDGINTFSGYASVFGGIDADGDTIHPGAFTKALQNTSEIKMYYNHGWRKGDMPIGKMFVKQDSVGLFVEKAEFTEGIPLAEFVAKAVKHGTVDGMSIGFGMREGAFKRKAAGRGADIFEIEYLKEVSVVDFPADSNARIHDIKSALEEVESYKEIEALLRDAGGFSRTDAKLLLARMKSMALREAESESEAKKALADVFAAFQL